VKRNRNRDRRALCPFLHDPVASALADRDKSVTFRIRQTSSPERMRSLPNRNLNLRYKDFFAEAPGNFGLIGGLEEQRECFN
jgi:hypothetical protein